MYMIYPHEKKPSIYIFNKRTLNVYVKTWAWERINECQHLRAFYCNKYFPKSEKN